MNVIENKKKCKFQEILMNITGTSILYKQETVMHGN